MQRVKMSQLSGRCGRAATIFKNHPWLPEVDPLLDELAIEMEPVMTGKSGTGLAKPLAGNQTP